MTPKVLKMITEVYKETIKERMHKANIIYEEVWEEVLEEYRRYSLDSTLDKDIEIDISNYLDEDEIEINELVSSMLKQDGFREAGKNYFTLPASVITCIANQQKEVQQLTLKNN